MKILKNLYQFIIPSHTRGEIKFLIFKGLRKLYIQPILRKAGVQICGSYLIVDTSNAEEIFAPDNTKTKIHKIIEKNITKRAIHFEESKLDEMEPSCIISEMVVLDTSEHKYTLSNNHLIDKNLNIIAGYRTEFEALPIYRDKLSKSTKLKGTVAYLSDTTTTNYYHWMCATLPLIRIYRELFNFDEIDYFYVGSSPLSNFHKDSLTKAGISINKIIQNACTADRMLVAINSRFKNFNDPISKEAYLYTRNLFENELNTQANNHRTRIYVQRGNTARRKVINENEIIDLLKNYGFQVVQMDNKTVKEQAEIFANAEAIVAPHGAALTNLLFANPKTSMIEIIPDGYTNNCFYVLASYGDLNYFYLKGDEIGKNNQAHYLDIHVNIKKLEKLIKAASLS